MNKTLLILPCNPGALLGNYFSGQLWKRWDKALRQANLRSVVDLAAVDCIIYFNVRDGLGSIVHESEMERVQGYDSHPASRFPRSRSQQQKIFEFSKDVAVGLERWHKEYDQIIVFCNQLAYRTAVRIALNNLNLWYKACLIDFPVIAPGIHQHAFKITFDCLRKGTVGTVRVPFSEMYHFKNKSERIEYEKRWYRIGELYSIEPKTLLQ